MEDDLQLLNGSTLRKKQPGLLRRPGLLKLTTGLQTLNGRIASAEQPTCWLQTYWSCFYGTLCPAGRLHAGGVSAFAVAVVHMLILLVRPHFAGLDTHSTHIGYWNSYDSAAGLTLNTLYLLGREGFGVGSKTAASWIYDRR